MFAKYVEINFYYFIQVCVSTIIHKEEKEIDRVYLLL